MITEAEASYQVRRMSQLRGYPQDPVALSELINALCGAEHETHAASVVRSFLDDAEHCPRPADLRRTIRETRSRTQPVCPICSGSGWVQRGEHLVTFGNQHAGIGHSVERLDHQQAKQLYGKLQAGVQGIYDASARCSCRGG